MSRATPSARFRSRSSTTSSRNIPPRWISDSTVAAPTAPAPTTPTFTAHPFARRRRAGHTRSAVCGPARRAVRSVLGSLLGSEFGRPRLLLRGDDLPAQPPDTGRAHHQHALQEQIAVGRDDPDRQDQAGETDQQAQAPATRPRAASGHRPRLAPLRVLAQSLLDAGELAALVVAQHAGGLVTTPTPTPGPAGRAGPVAAPARPACSART